MDVSGDFNFNFGEQNNEDISKCGEVFITKLGKFLIDCVLCGTRYEHEEYFDHILKKHFDVDENFILDTESQNKIKQCDFNVSPNNSRDYESLEYEFNINQKSKENKHTKTNNNKEINEITFPIEKRKTRNSDRAKCKQRLIENKNGRKKQRNFGIKNKDKNCSNVCDVCGLNLNKKGELLDHKKTHCGFRCSICSLILTNEKLLRSHHKETHNIKQEKIKVLEKIPHQVYVCEICGKDFNDASNLRAHIKKHDPDRKIYPCEKCDKKFLKEISLENHLKLKHFKNKPYVCKVEFCGRSFVNEKSLENHKAFHGDRKYECSICNKKYLYKSKLKEHVKLYHIQGRIHHCPECEKSFYDPWTLKSHMVCHSGEKPFQCDECDAKFPREKALLWHKKVHSGVKDYVCKLCNQAFYIYNGLYSHMKSHNIKYSKNMEKDLLLMAKNEQRNNKLNNENSSDPG